MYIDTSLKGNIMKLCYGDVLRTYKCSGLPCFLKPDVSLCLAVFQVFHPYMISQFGNVSDGTSGYGATSLYSLGRGPWSGFCGALQLHQSCCHFLGISGKPWGILISDSVIEE